MKKKIYCEDCKYCYFDGALSQIICNHEKNQSYVKHNNAYSDKDVRFPKPILEVNKNNDCSYKKKSWLF